MKKIFGKSSGEKKDIKISNKRKYQSELNPTYHGIQELLNNEIALKKYNKQTVKLIKDGLYQATSGSKILEFGAGTGTLALIFQDRYKVKVDCVEIDPTLKNFLQRRDLKTFSDLKDIEGKYSSIYSSNVLEHIENDEESINQLVEKLEIGGNLAIYVPAFPILYSELDRRVGHVRRYTRKELINKVSKAGLNVKYCRYSDSLGFFASIAIRIFGFNTKSGLGSIRSLKFYDRVIYPLSVLFDLLGASKYIGKNLIISAEKR
jgi:hypothetical protein